VVLKSLNKTNEDQKNKKDSRTQSRSLTFLVKRRLSKSGFIIINTVILGVIVYFVLLSPHASNVSATPLDSSSTVATTDPVDQVSAADIALTVAQESDLPETTAISNQAQTAAANLAMSSTSNNVVTKPEVVTTALKSKANIFSYTTKTGDTIASLAAKFGVTSNSLMWSNGLTSATVNAGTKLTIPPVNGIVYTVKAGDTPASLASTYKANAADITAYNDAEINGLTPGEQIIIPNGTLVSASNATASTASASSTSSPSSPGTAFPWGTSAIYGYNGYDFGYCTWYVATQISVPANWGNAATWAYYGALSGWNVSLTPTVGAIAQTAAAAGGEGHVAVVDAVSADGSEIQTRDMNGIAGWDKVGYSSWIPATTFQHFITP
jgi:surface antigen